MIYSRLYAFNASLKLSSKSSYEICSLSKEYSFACTVLNDTISLSYFSGCVRINRVYKVKIRILFLFLYKHENIHKKPRILEVII